MFVEKQKPKKNLFDELTKLMDKGVERELESSLFIRLKGKILWSRRTPKSVTIRVKGNCGFTQKRAKTRIEGGECQQFY